MVIVSPAVAWSGRETIAIEPVCANPILAIHAAIMVLIFSHIHSSFKVII